MGSGSSLATADLLDRYLVGDGTVLLTGVQALVRLLLDQARADRRAGLATGGFVTGYPGSPLAGLDLELARRLALLGGLGVVHRPGLNEELAATAVAGSQLAMLQPDHLNDGVFAMWYGKAPGLDRGSDALRHGNLMGAGRTGGVLVCVGDDPRAQSSSVPSTSEPTLYSLGMPILSPADPQGVLDLGLHGYAMSRASGLWVGVRLSATVADAAQSVEVGAGRVAPRAPEVLVDGRPFEHRVSARLLGATLLELEASLYGARIEAARAYGALNALNRVTERSDDDVVGVVASGPTYLAALSALEALGLSEGRRDAAGLRLLRVSMPFPLDDGVVRDFARGLREVVVLEDKRGFLEAQVREALYGVTGAPIVVGKRDESGRPLVPATGELDADAIAPVLARRLAARRDLAGVAAYMERDRPAPMAPLAVARGAYFCSGCPHNSSVKLPDGAIAGSGSGCHGLAIQMGPRQVGAVVGRFQMGGEGAMWNGMSPFVAREHFVQNIGDGTLAHSGSLAVRAAVASGVNITFKILVNSTVAMTGGQAVMGPRELRDLVASLRAEGVARVIVTTDDRRKHRGYGRLPRGVDVWDRRRIVEAQRVLAAVPGVTVLIHDQECAAELRRRRHRGTAPTPRDHVVVHPLVCEGCGDCGAKSNCLSVRPVSTPWGRVVEIDQESCNFDYSCLNGECPALMTVRVGAPQPKSRARAGDDGALPDPTARVDADDFTLRLSGIGGTGVLTVAQVVAMAAHLDGRHVRSLDQTGIAQKGGTVVSDLRVSTAPADGTHRLGEGRCDLYLGFDPLVAADERVLSPAAAGRTFAVVSTSTTPTGREVAEIDVAAPPLAALRERVDARSRRGENAWLDARSLATERLGSDRFANVLLLGVAFQRGLLPLSADAVHRAIELNGVEVADNRLAFESGRRLGVPADGAGAGGAEPGADADADLDAFVSARVTRLTQFQSAAYAARYAALVAAVRVAESRVGAPDGPLSRAVAREAFRVMAYKDEYEVARLHLDPAARSAIEEEFGRGARVTYHLTPPVLAALGMKRKIRITRGATTMFRILRAARRLRGTPLDPFGLGAHRRAERQLRDDYLARVAEMCAGLTEQNHAAAVAEAGAVAGVRGYGSVKERSLAAYREQSAAVGAPDGPVSASA